MYGLIKNLLLILSAFVCEWVCLCSCSKNSNGHRVFLVIFAVLCIIYNLYSSDIRSQHSYICTHLVKPKRMYCHKRKSAVKREQRDAHFGVQCVWAHFIIPISAFNFRSFVSHPFRVPIVRAGQTSPSAQSSTKFNLLLHKKSWNILFA